MKTPSLLEHLNLVDTTEEAKKTRERLIAANKEAARLLLLAISSQCTTTYVERVAKDNYE